MNRGTTATLLLAVFTVSAGYGAVLPHLPDLVERLLGQGVQQAQISRHTGMLTGVYTFALFLFAPLWGRASDRLGRRGVLFAGLAGFGVATLVLSSAESLAALYAERFVSAAFAAAVTPVAAAAIGELAAAEQARARHLALLSMGGIAGFLLGPMLGAATEGAAGAVLGAAKPAGTLVMPLAAIALLAFAAALAVAFAVPGGNGGARLVRPPGRQDDHTGRVLPRLLALSFIVSAGIGVFEVGLALRGKQQLGLTPFQIALMFAECSLIMFAIQGIVFSRRIKPEARPALIAPALAVLAAGLLLVSWSTDYAFTLALVGAVAASAGILSPLLTYWISSKAGRAQGWELGKQTAAASLGVTLGSAVAGLLFNAAALPGAPFVLAAALAAAGVLLSLGLRRALAPGRAGA